MSNEYAIVRFEKVKNVGDLKRLSSHIDRTGSQVSNAKEPYDAPHFIGNDDLVKGVQDSWPEKYRSDAVLAMSFVLTASPSVFLDESGRRDPAKTALFETAAREFLKNEFGECVHAKLHLDEKTPHVQGFIVPNKDFVPGQTLVAKNLFTPRTLSIYQTIWHEKMKSVGFDVMRGVRGSQAKHERIRDYYDRVNAKPAPLPPVPAPVPAATGAELLQEKMGIETARSVAQAARTRAISERNGATHDQRKIYAAKCTELEAKNKLLKERAAKAEAQNVILKAATAKLRAVPVLDVLAALGAQSHPVDKNRWETEAGSIWVEADGDKFNSLHSETEHLKGRGAIDLVMKVKNFEFKEAVSFLAKQFDSSLVVGAVTCNTMNRAPALVRRAAKSPAAPEVLPTPTPAHSARLRLYLVEMRGLPGRLVDRLTKAGRIFADQFSNAVFKNDAGDGFEMRGTGKGSSWKGQRGRKSGFTVPGLTKHVAIVESAIEALSLHAINGFTTISTGGTNSKIATELAKRHLHDGAAVYAAQNADKGGDAQAKALMNELPGVTRLRPGKKDWNDVLRSEPAAENSFDDPAEEHEQEEAPERASAPKI